MSERIARVSPAQIVTLRDSVCGLENLYPGLDVWFARRIEPGLRDGSRIGLTAFRRGLLAGSAVVRPGERAKLSHFLVEPAYRCTGLAARMMRRVIVEAGYPRSIYFTMADSIFATYANLLSRLGFTAQPCKRRYRNGERDMVCEADGASLLRRLA